VGLIRLLLCIETRMAYDKSQDIRDRTFRFGCDVARLALSIEPRPGLRRLADQLVSAGTSIGANLEEAKAGSSKRDFIRYLEIALRESREAKYWLRIFIELELCPLPGALALRDEADQIARILGAIVVSSKRRLLAGYSAFAFCLLTFALLIS
jgi:four helix bundle protein